MLRFGLALFSAWLRSGSHLAQAASAQAADLGACLDPATVIGAGGDVSDKELAAAQGACAQLKQTTQDQKVLMRINAAAATLAAEAKRRGKVNRRRERGVRYTDQGPSRSAHWISCVARWPCASGSAANAAASTRCAGRVSRPS